MKKIFSLITFVLIFTLLFTACKKEPNYAPDDGVGYSGEILDGGVALDEVPLKENTVTNISALVDLFNAGSPETMGEQYTQIFNTVKADNYVIRPLVNGEDISQTEDYALIEVMPKANEGEFSHIAYYYTNGTHNYAIRVYYLTEDELNVALTGGYHKLTNGEEAIITRETYNNFTIIYFPDKSGYAEIILNEKYLVTVRGANIENEKFPYVIEKEALDILTFDEVQLDNMVG